MKEIVLQFVSSADCREVVGFGHKPRIYAPRFRRKSFSHAEGQEEGAFLWISFMSE
jgi:hypothetical protein